MPNSIRASDPIDPYAASESPMTRQSIDSFLKHEKTTFKIQGNDKVIFNDVIYDRYISYNVNSIMDTFRMKKSQDGTV